MRPSYPPESPPQPQSSRTPILDHLSLVAGRFARHAKCFSKTSIWSDVQQFVVTIAKHLDQEVLDLLFLLVCRWVSARLMLGAPCPVCPGAGCAPLRGSS